MWTSYQDFTKTSKWCHHQPLCWWWDDQYLLSINANLPLPSKDTKIFPEHCYLWHLTMPMITNHTLHNSLKSAKGWNSMGHWSSKWLGPMPCHPVTTTLSMPLTYNASHAATDHANYMQPLYSDNASSDYSVHLAALTIACKQMQQCWPLIAELIWTMQFHSVTAIPAHMPLACTTPYITIDPLHKNSLNSMLPPHTCLPLPVNHLRYGSWWQLHWCCPCPAPS